MLNSIRQCQLTLFLVACLLGILFIAIWLVIGEQWEVLGDGGYYIKMYQGETISAPFGHRVLVPFLARLMPFGTKASFGVITFSCLILTCGIIAIYFYGSDKMVWKIPLTFWVTSFAFIYYGTTIIRVDTLTLFLIAVLFLLTKKRVAPFLLLCLIIIGALAHETIFICVPILWIDKYFALNLAGGRYYKYSYLMFIFLASILSIAIIRMYIPISPASVSYLSNPLGMISYVLDKNGGLMNQILRIYAAYGPAVLYALFFAAPWRSKNTFWGFYTLYILTIIATFFAVDTLRVMALIYMPIFIYASKYLSEVWLTGKQFLSISLLILQLIFSFVVFGHLRSFEHTFSLNLIAAVISILTLAICIVNEYYFLKFRKV